MQFICSCGDTAKISYHGFKQSPNCRNCGIEKCASASRLSYEFVKNEFETNGCKLISTEYHNNSELLDYICECGNSSKIAYRYFQQGQRCGCLRVKSKGEVAIKNILEKLNLQCITQHKYSDCKNKKILLFDFFVNNKFIVEFDGKQHFQQVSIFGGIDAFTEQKKCDRIKNIYCIKNNIPILRISYKEKNNLFFIIKLYVGLIEKNIAPPILFTNKDLYKNMYNGIKDLTIANVFIKI